MTIYVAVVGGSRCSPDATKQAESVGRLLAERGAIVVTGGRTGVAEAASRGAAEAGGVTLGLLPGRDRAEANPWVQVAVPTGLGETRNALVALAADVVVAFPGLFGTLSEIAHALNDGTPVVGLGTWDLPPPDGNAGDAPPILTVDDPETAVEAALALATDRTAGS